MKKLNTKLLSILTLFCITNVQAQIGIQNLTIEPNVNLDVKGTIRLRQLNPSNESKGLIVINSNGLLGIKKSLSSAFIDSDLYISRMNDYVSTTSNASSSDPLDLGVKIDVIITPHATALLTLDFNIPVAAINRSNSLAAYIGLIVNRSSNDININDQTFTERSSRKVSTYKINPQLGDYYRFTTSIEGDALDIITNHTDNPITVTYEVFGLIEEIPVGCTVYFGGMINDLGDAIKYGKGLFSIDAKEIETPSSTE